LLIFAAGSPKMICSCATALHFGKLISAVAGKRRCDVKLRRQRAEMVTHLGGANVLTLALARTSPMGRDWDDHAWRVLERIPTGGANAPTVSCEIA
jgi:hypothetical protein